MVTRSAAVAAAALVTLAVGALAAELLARPLRELRIQAEALPMGISARGNWSTLEAARSRISARRSGNGAAPR